MTGMAPNRVAQTHVRRLLSLTAERSSKLVGTPKFKIGDRVRIAKEDLPFRKGYKQSFTDELFRITSVKTFITPTFSLADAEGEDIQGQFHEPKLTKVKWNG